MLSLNRSQNLKTKVKRIFHTWDKWECYPAGFYEEKPITETEKSKDELELEYAKFLSDEKRFRAGLNLVLSNWKNSCEHYLSNENMNRIAWLGQSAACAAIGLPSSYRGGFHKLSEPEQQRADSIALDALNEWLFLHGEPILTMEKAQSKTEANLY